MPITNVPEHLRQKAPVLTVAQIEAARATFVQSIDRELLIHGAEVRTPEMIDTLNALRTGAREELVVESTLSGPFTKFRDTEGRRLSPEGAANALVQEARERAALLAYGPDPVAVVTERLIALGVPPAEASSRAQRRIQRLPDGRVVRINTRGEPIDSRPAKQDAETFTPEQLAHYRDHQGEATAATRAILAEIEADTHKRPAPYSDPADALRSAF